MTYRKFIRALLLLACLSIRWCRAQAVELGALVADTSSIALPIAQITVTRKDTEQTIPLNGILVVATLSLALAVKILCLCGGLSLSALAITGVLMYWHGFSGER